MTELEEREERRERLRVRIAELKREDWPRLRLEHLDPEGTSRWAEGFAAVRADPDLTAIVDRYLRSLVPGECPGCGYGMFGWGMAHGAGQCTCGWPGYVYHHVLDDRDLPDTVCAATCNRHRVCWAARADHVEEEVPWISDGGGHGVHVEWRCPSPQAPPGINPAYFRSRWTRPEVVYFQAMMWAHPYTVHLTAE